MNNLSTYILEKLRINKNTEIDDSVYEKVIDDIYKMCDSKVLKNTKKGEETKSVITDWVKNNYVDKVIGYGNHKELFDAGMYEEDIKLFTNTTTKSLKETFEKYKNKKIFSIEETTKTEGRVFYGDETTLIVVDSWLGKDKIKVFKKTD